MQKLINLAVRLSGAGWVWNKLDGYKTYGAGALSILVGLAGVGQELSPILAGHDAGALWAFLKLLPKDQAFLMLMLGLKAIGIGHKLDKAAEAVPLEAPKP